MNRLPHQPHQIGHVIAPPEYQNSKLKDRKPRRWVCQGRGIVQRQFASKWPHLKRVLRLSVFAKLYPSFLQIHLLASCYPSGVAALGVLFGGWVFKYFISAHYLILVLLVVVLAKKLDP